jgi:hypothetical protein
MGNESSVGTAPLCQYDEAQWNRVVDACMRLRGPSLPYPLPTSYLADHRLLSPSVIPPPYAYKATDMPRLFTYKEESAAAPMSCLSAYEERSVTLAELSYELFQRRNSFKRHQIAVDAAVLKASVLYFSSASILKVFSSSSNRKEVLGILLPKFGNSKTILVLIMLSVVDILDVFTT